MYEVLSKFSLMEIQRIVRTTRLLFLRKVVAEEKLTEAESIGFEKCIYFCIQLQGLAERVKQHLHKDNSVVSRKSIFNYCLSFSRYREGEFVELDPPLKQVRNLGQVYVPTLRSRFCEYAHLHAFQNYENVLWRGEPMSGKTSALTYSLEEVFRVNPEAKNLLRVCVNPGTGSKGVAGSVEERMSGKEEERDPKTMLVFVDDIHLCSEEMGEFFRFATEYQKIFSYRAKEVVAMARHVFIADCNNANGKEFTGRFARHFAELTLPPSDENAIRTIFA
jgi:hypothetical protein